MTRAQSLGGGNQDHTQHESVMCITGHEDTEGENESLKMHVVNPLEIIKMHKK